MKAPRWFSDFKQDASYEHYMRNTVHDAEVLSKSWAWCYAVTLGFWIAGLCAAAICYFRGHTMVDDSHAGPDSGSMAGHCERCGYSFHTTLY